MGDDSFAVKIEGVAARQLAELAELSGRSRDWYANHVIREYAVRELAIVRELKRRLDSAMAGNVVPHEEVMAEIGTMIEDAKRRRSA